MYQRILQGYVDPKSVNSPKDKWKELIVIYNSAQTEQDKNSWSLAVGKWEGARNLAIRWNGDENTLLGSPKSHARATWFVVPREIAVGILVAISREPDVNICDALSFLNGVDNE
jgi:hypothetical protein